MRKRKALVNKNFLSQNNKLLYYVKNNYVEINKNTVKKNMVLLNNFITTSINLINSH